MSYHRLTNQSCPPELKGSSHSKPIPELLPVVQADRNRASDILDALLCATEPKMMSPDECEGIIQQILAAHRIEHSTPDRNALERAFREGFSLGDFAGGGQADPHTVDRAWKNSRSLMTLTTTPEPTDPAGVSEMEELERVACAIYNCGEPTREHYAWDELAVEDDTSRQWFLRRARAAIAALRTPDPVLEMVKEALERVLRCDSQGFPECPMGTVTHALCEAALRAINERSNHEG